MNKIDESIARLLSREQDYSDLLTLNEWLNENPDNREKLETLGRYWEKEAPGDLRAAEASFNANMNGILDGKADGKRRKWLRPAFASCAALALVALVLGLFAIWNSAPERIHCYSAQGAVCHFELPDGSEVDLNNGSELEYCEPRTGKNRQVSLNGEGFFNIRHDSAHPFLVKAGDAGIKVVGTKFNVRCGGADNLVVTTLVEGRVEFCHKGDVIALAPNEQLVYDISNGQTVKSFVEAGRYTAWKEGLFRYKSITLGELAEELSANYGKRVLIDSSLRDVVMSGAFRRDQSLEEILRILQSCLDVQWRYNEDMVYLTSK